MSIGHVYNPSVKIMTMRCDFASQCYVDEDIQLKALYSAHGWRAEWIELSPRSREVAGSSPGRAKPQAFELVLVVSSLHAQEDKTRIEWPDVFIM